MEDMQQQVLNAINKGRRAKSAANPFQETTVRFATAAATAVQPDNVAAEAENIHLRTGKYHGTAIAANAHRMSRLASPSFSSIP